MITKIGTDQTALGCSVHDDQAVDEGGRLAAFRQGLYGCFRAWPDALFEVSDAVAGAAHPVRSVAELMLEPGSRRGWGSLYQGVERGRIDPEATRDLLAAQVRVITPGAAVMFAVDASTFPRPDTRFVGDLGRQYAADREGTGGAPSVPGWSMRWIAQVGLDPGGARSSWALPVDVRRVGTAENANEVAAAQITDLTARLDAAGCIDHGRGAALFLLDSGYCPIYLTQQRPAGAALLVRLRGDRTFWSRPPEPVPGAGGRPRKHGARFALDKPGTWGPPDAEVTEDTGTGATVRTRAWHAKHPRPRQRRKWEGTAVVEGTLIRREVHHRSGNVQVWWLWWAGPADAFDLAMLAQAYPHRFTLEHTFRFDKQDLGWTAHTPLDADQAQRWSWLILAAHAQLVLARPLVADRRLPWETRCAAHQLSPRRVRRGFRDITAALPSPARAPKPSRPGPGRPPGSPNKITRERKPVITKGRAANTGHKRGQSPLAMNAQR